MSASVRLRVIVRSSIVVSALALVGSLLSFANQLLIAYAFGASHAVDGYLVAMSAPTVVAGVLMSILSYALVPQLVQRDTHPAQLGAYLRSVSGSILGFAAFTAIAGIACADLLLPVLAPDVVLNGTQLTMCRIAWLNAGLQIFAGLLSAVCTARRQYIRVGLAALFPYAGMAVSTWALAGAGGIVVIPLGLLIGTAASILALLGGIRDILRLACAAPFDAEPGRAFLARIPMIGMSMTCFSGYALVDAYYVPSMGEGSLSYIGYCQRILIAVGGLITMGPSTVLVPHFARHVAEGRMASFRREAFAACGVVILLALGAALLGGVFAHDGVRLLFQRGAFDQRAVDGVSSVLPLMLVGMAPMLGSTMLYRALYCVDEQRWLAVIGLGWTGLYFLLAQLFGHWKLTGLATAYSLSWLIALIFLAWRLSKAGARGEAG